MTSAFSWQNFISFCSTSFCTARTNLPVTPGISSLPTFAFQSPVMKRTSSGGISSRRPYRTHTHTHTHTHTFHINKHQKKTKEKPDKPIKNGQGS